MKATEDIGLADVQAVYSGPEGDLWELIMGEQIHIGGFASSMDLAERAGIAAGDFVEYNDVFASGLLYGSLKSEVEKGLADESLYTVMEIDVQGALNLKTLEFRGRYIFIQPPSMEELRNRLRERDTEGDNEIEQRLAKAAWEMRQAWQYDKIVVNGDLEKAIRETEEYLGLVG